MKAIIFSLLAPLPIAGGVALVLKVYADTADAQRASADLISSLVVVPGILLYLGLLALMLSVAYLIFSFASAGAHRVRQTTTLKSMQTLRLANRDTIVARKMLDSGYSVLEPERIIPNAETDHADRHASGDTSIRSDATQRTRFDNQDSHDALRRRSKSTRSEEMFQV